MELFHWVKTHTNLAQPIDSVGFAFWYKNLSENEQILMASINGFVEKVAFIPRGLPTPIQMEHSNIQSDM